MCASGDVLTVPTVAAGKVFVAAADAAVVYALDAAVFQGLAATGGRLYVCLHAGGVLCMGAAASR